MSPQPGSYNWTQVAWDDDDDFADRMSREASIYVGAPPENTWGLLESSESHRGYLDAKTANAVAEIEKRAGRTLRFREADVGRGASGSGTVVAIVEAVAVAGGAAAAVRETARLVRWSYQRIARAKGRRPMISLGAAEHLAMADLIDRVDAVPRLLGSGDMNSNNQDRAFTGGDAFFVVLATESELHHYHVSAYGEVYYIGTSPLIPNFMEEPSPPYWAGGDGEGRQSLWLALRYRLWKIRASSWLHRRLGRRWRR